VLSRHPHHNPLNPRQNRQGTSVPRLLNCLTVPATIAGPAYIGLLVPLISWLSLSPLHPAPRLRGFSDRPFALCARQHIRVQSASMYRCTLSTFAVSFILLLANSVALYSVLLHKLSFSELYKLFISKASALSSLDVTFILQQTLISFYVIQTTF